MRRTFFLLAITLGGVAGGYSQGMLNFANAGVGVNAPIYLYTYTNNLTVPLTGPDYAAQLFYAAPGTGNSISSYTPLSSVVPFQPPGFGAGYFLGGTTSIPGFAQGSTISIIVAAFSTAQGSTWLESRSRGGAVGFGLPVSVTLVGGILPPPNLIGLQSFNLAPIDEPPTTLLLACGAGLFLLWKRGTWRRAVHNPGEQL